MVPESVQHFGSLWSFGGLHTIYLVDFQLFQSSWVLLCDCSSCFKPRRRSLNDEVSTEASWTDNSENVVVRNGRHILNICTITIIYPAYFTHKNANITQNLHYYHSHHTTTSHLLLTHSQTPITIILLLRGHHQRNCSLKQLIYLLILCIKVDISIRTVSGFHQVLWYVLLLFFHHILTVSTNSRRL